MAIGALMVFRSSARLISSIFSLRLDRNLQIWCFLSRVAISESDADNTITPLSSMVLAVSGENPASIRKFGLEIKNRCTLKGISGEILASIPKSGPEIENQCTIFPRFDPGAAVILDFKPRLGNRCSVIAAAVRNGPPAPVVAATRSASDSNFRCRNRELFRLHRS